MSNGEPITTWVRQLQAGDVHAAQKLLQRLAKTYKPLELANVAYSLYEQFRPAIPAGVKGWGAKGTLDLEQIQALGRK